MVSCLKTSRLAHPAHPCLHISTIDTPSYCGNVFQLKDGSPCRACPAYGCVLVLRHYRGETRGKEPLFSGFSPTGISVRTCTRLQPASRTKTDQTFDDCRLVNCSPPGAVASNSRRLMTCGPSSRETSRGAMSLLETLMSRGT